MQSHTSETLAEKQVVHSLAEHFASLTDKRDRRGESLRFSPNVGDLGCG